MGTTLTGTTPATTYDSLIKVTDNGPIGATLKTLSDGLGNDSALALSTKALQIKKTDTIQTSAGCISHFTNDYIYYFGGAAGIVISDFASTARLQIYNNSAVAFEAGSAERMRIDSTGNVGIGTSAPDAKLQVVGAFAQQIRFGTNTSIYTNLSMGTGFTTFDSIGGDAGAYSFRDDGVTRLFIDSSGNVGIGTTSPASKMHVQNGALQVSGNSIDTIVSYSTVGIVGTATAHDLQIVRNGAEICRVTANGLTFNGDTAAANALDDYEEGTFTPTFAGVTYSGATSNVGRYTKIGRLVHFDIFLYDAAFSSSSGSARISGFPFTANTQVYGQGLITYNTAVDGNTNGGYIDAGSTNFYPVDENSTAVSSFINGTVSLMVSGTYTV